MSKAPARRELWVVLGGAVAAAGLLALACGRTWASVAVVAPGLPHTAVALSGRTLAPAAFALGLAALAGAFGTLATRGWARRAVAAAVAACGAGAGLATWAGVQSDLRYNLAAIPAGARLTGGFTAWPWVALVAAAFVTCCGVLAAVRGPRWPGMGTRYDAPAARAAATEGDMWRVLDRGDDPTA